MIRNLFIFLLCASLSGCIPLKQTKFIPDREDFIGHVECDGSLDVGWRHENTLDESRKPNVNERACFAISPNGKRHNLRFILSGRDIGSSYWRTASIWLIDASNPKKNIKWNNGLWTIHLEFLPPHENLVFNSQIKVWTFFYNPIIHGPPN